MKYAIFWWFYETAGGGTKNTILSKPNFVLLVDDIFTE